MSVVHCIWCGKEFEGTIDDSECEDCATDPMDTPEDKPEDEDGGDE